jgi:hypothetical protein
VCRRVLWTELKTTEVEGMVNWINVARDREKWWAVVSTVMNIRVLKMRGDS